MTLLIFEKIKKTVDSFPSSIFQNSKFWGFVVNKILIFTIWKIIRKLWICKGLYCYCHRWLMRFTLGFLKNHPALIMHLPTISLIVRFWMREEMVALKPRAQFHRYYYYDVYCSVVWSSVRTTCSSKASKPALLLPRGNSTKTTTTKRHSQRCVII